MEHLRADYTEVWVASQNVPLIRFADKVRGIVSTGLDLVGITEPPMAELSGFDSIVSWYGTARPEFREAVAGLPFEFLDALPKGGLHAVDFYSQQLGAPLGAAPRIKGREKIHTVQPALRQRDRKSTRLNSSSTNISYPVF